MGNSYSNYPFKIASEAGYELTGSRLCLANIHKELCLIIQQKGAQEFKKYVASIKDALENMRIRVDQIDKEDLESLKRGGRSVIMLAKQQVNNILKDVKMTTNLIHHKARIMLREYESEMEKAPTPQMAPLDLFIDLLLDDVRKIINVHLGILERDMSRILNLSSSPLGREFRQKGYHVPTRAEEVGHSRLWMEEDDCSRLTNQDQVVTKIFLVFRNLSSRITKQVYEDMEFIDDYMEEFCWDLKGVTYAALAAFEKEDQPSETFECSEKMRKFMEVADDPDSECIHRDFGARVQEEEEKEKEKEEVVEKDDDGEIIDCSSESSFEMVEIETEKLKIAP